MSKAEIQQDAYEKLINDYIESRTNAGIYLLKMAQVIAEAKNRLSRKMFKRFLKDSRINLQRLQANKMIAIYELAKSDSRLTQIFNKEGVEKSYLITTIKDEKAREKFSEQIIDVSFTVKQTKQAVQKINSENKNPVQAIEEVQNKIGTQKPKEQKKTVPVEEYEKLKSENEQLKLKLAELQEKQPKEPVQKIEKSEKKQPEKVTQNLPLFEPQGKTNLDYLN